MGDQIGQYSTEVLTSGQTGLFGLRVGRVEGREGVRGYGR